MAKSFKSILALLLVAIMMLSVVACKDDKPADTNTSTETETTEEESSEEESVYVDPWTDTDENGNAMRDPNYEVLNYENMKGIWLSQFDMQPLYAASSKQRPEAAFTKTCESICKSLAKEGFNTIIVQLRPNGDSFYPSDLYCPSEYVVSAYGKDFDYDMLRIFIRIAHKYNLSFHAWINPMRLMKDSDISKVSTDYKIGEWYNDAEKRENYMYLADNGYWYLVPGWEEVRQLVADGAKEICERYNIDALQIDDYFYPVTNMEFDKEHYELNKDKYPKIAPYRIAMVNAMVSQLYTAVHETGVEFGISPAGNIRNNVNSLYADVRRWCSNEGFCDFIIPQVYWGMEDPNPDNQFDNCCLEWQKICTSDSVRLIIGIDLDNCSDLGGGAAAEEFKNNKDCIKKQLVFLTTMEKNSGFAMFSYKSLFGDSGALVKLKLERENFLPVVKTFPELPAEEATSAE